MHTEPHDAYTTAYDALASTPIADDRDFRSKVARQVVDTLKHMRAEQGLAWLRKVGNSNSYYQALRSAQEQFGPNPDLLIGRMELWRVYETTAATFIAAYSRRTH